MVKKVISLLLVCVVTLSLVACGNNANQPNTPDAQNTPTSNGDNSSTENSGTVNVDLSQTITFMGYSIAYPSDASKNSSDYGNLIGTSEYCLLIEAPSTAGIILEASSIGDVPSMCEEYIFETLEHKIRSLFDFDSTSQTIAKSTEVTYNGIKMLMASGSFTNEVAKTEIAFSAIYLLAGDNGNIPVYIIGIPMTENYNVSKIVESIAKNIKK